MVSMKNNKWILRIGLVCFFIMTACTTQDSTSDQPIMDVVVDGLRREADEEPNLSQEGINAEDEEGDEAQGRVNLESAPTQDLVEPVSPISVPPLSEGEWMSLPVIPELSERALEIYAEGIKRGNDPHSFSKVGDCQNVPSMFVSIFDHPGFYSLGEEYDYLSKTIEWFQGSFEYESEAVRRGFNAASVVSPVWADPDACEIGENPLNCELRIHNPSIAIVSLETWWAGNPDNYEKYVRQILETLIDHGVLPILATKADNLEGDHHINNILAGLANEYQIPLWNFWLVVQPLPNHGLMDDGFHLTFAANKFDDPLVMQAAWPWRNLTALQVLDAVRSAVQAVN
jgi:hypothetical protein